MNDEIENKSKFYTRIKKIRNQNNKDQSGNPYKSEDNYEI
jgi:hypothetical protein